MLEMDEHLPLAADDCQRLKAKFFGLIFDQKWITVRKLCGVLENKHEIVSR